MFFPIFVRFALIVSVLRVSVYKSTNIYKFFAQNFGNKPQNGTKIAHLAAGLGIVRKIAT